MTIDKQRMAELLKNDKYPRSAQYDPQWVLEGWMGPNVLWLAEWLTGVMDLKPGMRVLDMGCGKAHSSVFLAKEYGVQVFANDLWVSATENWQRIRAVSMEDRIVPIHAEAHALPYAEDFFDAIVSIDAYQYFGTDDLYLNSFGRLLRPGGQIGIVVPAVVREFEGTVPEHLAVVGPKHDLWVDECRCFHTPEWWRTHWTGFSFIDVECADFLQDGWKDWLQYEKACDEAGTLMFASEAPMLEADHGQYLGLARVVARRKQ